ncbi:MAG: glycosyltransferase family 2 protein [Candidatus Levybacteria bacterium]|nr:glycosyltransferase family 2 protein [Candidatus Levybacteria bacterium]
MKLSIIVPTFNSEKRIEKLIERIIKVKLGNIEKEIIVIDDSSKDQTLQKLKKIKNIILISHKKNTGKGGAIGSGLKKATGDILFIQDDDFEYDPDEIPQIIKPILREKAELVFGSRRLNKKNKYSSLTYYWGGVFLDNIFSLILRTRISDSLTGSKAFTRKFYNILKPIETKGFEIEAEITAKAVRNGIIPFEIPITYSPRTHKQGKNIRWHHAFPVIKALIKFSYFS